MPTCPSRSSRPNAAWLELALIEDLLLDAAAPARPGRAPERRCSRQPARRARPLRDRKGCAPGCSTSPAGAHPPHPPPSASTSPRRWPSGTALRLAFQRLQALSAPPQRPQQQNQEPNAAQAGSSVPAHTRSGLASSHPKRAAHTSPSTRPNALLPQQPQLPALPAHKLPNGPVRARDNTVLVRRRGRWRRWVLGRFGRVAMLGALDGVVGHLALDDARVGAEPAWREQLGEESRRSRAHGLSAMRRGGKARV